MVRLRAAEDLHDTREQTLDAGAHVGGLGRQPHGVDADHRSSSRIRLDIPAVAEDGQAIVIVSAPRRSSTRTLLWTTADASIASGTKFERLDLLFPVHRDGLERPGSRSAHSHSIVAGGLLLTS